MSAAFEIGSALHEALFDAQMDFASVAYEPGAPPYDPADETADFGDEQFGSVRTAMAIARRVCVRAPIAATEEYRDARDALDRVAIDFAKWAEAHPTLANANLCRSRHTNFVFESGLKDP